MPHLIVTDRAERGVARCWRFIAEKSPRSADRAAGTIERSLKRLETVPELGRPHDELPGLRELLIPFGASGYVALYLHEPSTDAVYILAFRHQKELDY